MALTWFKTQKWKTTIEPVEVERQTAKSLILNGLTWRGLPKITKVSKASEYHSYFATWDEAHDFLLKRAQSRVASARRQLEFADSELGNVKGMKHPTAEAA